MSRAFKTGTQRRRILAKLLRQQKNRCALCDNLLDDETATIDHIKPLSRGGAKRDPANLQATCPACNRLKGDTWQGESSSAPRTRWPKRPVTAAEFYRVITRSSFNMACRQISAARGDHKWTCCRCGKRIPYGRRCVVVVDANAVSDGPLWFRGLALAHHDCGDLDARAHGSEWIRAPLSRRS